MLVATHMRSTVREAKPEPRNEQQCNEYYFKLPTPRTGTVLTMMSKIPAPKFLAFLNLVKRIARVVFELLDYETWNS